MGQFSWMTQDTERSIVNYFGDLPTFEVIMTDDRGGRWIEKNYEGYGVFGGKDYYELVDQMNGGVGDRDKGIEIAFSGDKFKVKFPSLSENGDYFRGRQPDICPDQGFGYVRD